MFQDLSDHPISRVEWVDVNLLNANDYNPNHVQDPEMRLLAFSLTRQGWIQPILVHEREDGTLVIIDGFHRHTLLKTNKEVWAMTRGLAPIVKMKMTEAERMLLTIRINRAKGNHAAIRMHEIVHKLVHQHGMTVKAIGEEIGADKDEVETLLVENVFEAKKTKEHNYSKAWIPTDCVEHGMAGGTA